MHPLRQYLADHDLKQADLARLLKVSRPVLHRWLDGTRSPHPKYWQTIKDVTGIPPSALLGTEALEAAE